MDCRAAMALVDKEQEQVVGLVEDGSLLYAWDIALEPGRGAKELRILPACIDAFRGGADCKLTWAEVMALLVPARPALTASEIARTLNASELHTYSLLRKGELHPLSGQRRGPGGSAQVLAYSFGEFLRRRRWPRSD